VTGRGRALRLALVVAVVGLVLGIALIPLGFPPLRSDDGWFKGPAAELATHGQLSDPGITGFFPRSHELFAVYPPLQQLCLAAWFAVLGVSLTSSLAYAYAVHVLCVIAASVTGLRLLRGFELSPAVAWTAAAIAGATWAANLEFLDRQEELALLFVWLELALAGHAVTPGGAVRTGVLVGLAALASPWVGLLAAAIVTLRAAVLAAEPAIDARSAATSLLRVAAPVWGISGVVSALTFCVWVAWLETKFPGGFREQFLGNMKFTTHAEPYPPTIGAWLATCAESVGHEPFLLPAALFTIGVFPAVYATMQATAPELRRDARIAAVVYAVAVGSLPISLYLRPYAYTYVWANFELLAPCLAIALVRYLGDASNRAFGAGIAAAIALVAWGDPLRDVAAAAVQTPDERASAVIASLQAAIPAGDVVCTTSRHWLAFQGRNPWRDAIFLYKRDPALLDDCEWLVLRAGRGADQPAIMDQFELTRQIPSESADNVTYAYALWHRR
jgi:hypothetical protein